MRRFCQEFLSSEKYTLFEITSVSYDHNTIFWQNKLGKNNDKSNSAAICLNPYFFYKNEVCFDTSMICNL